MRNEVEAQAIDWLIRQRDPDFADWDIFADWLEQDPSHLAIYDSVASLDVDLETLPKPAISFELPKRAASTRRKWLGGAMAAALVGVFSYSVIGLGDNASRIETIAGQHRTLHLADGSQIELNGATLIELDKDRPRFAKLESGEAMFRVVHREGDPFTVQAGDAKLVDMGTAFNVVRRDSGISVAVSQGMIVYNPERENVRVDAGKGLDAVKNSRPQLGEIDVQSVGGWRTGQLVYSGTSIAEVANDLGRTTGMKITVSPNVAALPFRGALIVGKDENRAIADLTALAGIRAVKKPDGWLLTR